MALIFFYVPNVGDPKTLDVVPQGGFKFKGDVTVNPTGLDTSGSAGKVSDSLATYKFKIISPSKQGKAEVTGIIERIPTGGGGKGSSPPERPFDISVLQQWERLIMGTNETDSVGLTNLIVCAGTTNQIFAKVFLGDMTTPSSGKVHWSLAPTTLGTFTANDVILTSGVAKTMFIAETNGDSGMTKADATELKDAANNSLPNISTNMTVNISKVEFQSLEMENDHAPIFFHAPSQNFSTIRAPDSLPGVSFDGKAKNGTAASPFICPGTLELAQAVTTSRTITFRDGTSLQRISTSFLVDSNPYPSLPDNSNPPIMEVLGDDAPKLNMPDTAINFVTFASVNDNFKLFLQFHPTTGAIQPLGKATWAFQAILRRQNGQLVLTTGRNVVPNDGAASTDVAPKTPPTPNITSTPWVAIGRTGGPAPANSQAARFKAAVENVNP